MMDHIINAESFIDLTASATAVEYSWLEADDEEPRRDGRDGCWQVYLQSADNSEWIGETTEEADAIAFAEKIGRFLKIDVRKAQQ